MILIAILLLIFISVLIAGCYWRQLSEETLYENHKLKERIEYLEYLIQKHKK